MVVLCINRKTLKQLATGLIMTTYPISRHFSALCIISTLSTSYRINHLAEEMRRREEIQLLEGAVLSAGAGFVTSVGATGLEEFLFVVPA